MAYLVLFILIYLGLIVVSTFRPATAVAGIISLFALEQWAQAKVAFFGSHPSFINLAMGLIVLYALLIAIVKGQRLFQGYPRVGWLTIALFSYAVISLSWTIGGTRAVENLRYAGPYMLVVVLIAPLLIGDIWDLRTTFMSLLTLGTLVMVLLVLTTQVQGRSVQLEGDLREFGGNPGTVAQLAGYLMFMALLMRFQGTHRIWLVLRWVVVAAGFIVMMRSQMRGQFFASILCVILFVPLSRPLIDPKKFIGTALSSLLVLAVAYFIFRYFVPSQGNRWDFQNMADTMRGSRWETSMNVIRYWWSSGPLYWLIGIGTSGSFAPQANGFYPEVVPLEVLAEEGILGFGLLMLVIGTTYRSIWRIFRIVRQDSELRGLVAAAAALFTYEFILSCKQGNLLGNFYLFTFAIMIGRFEVNLLARCRQAQEWEQANVQSAQLPAQT